MLAKSSPFSSEFIEQFDICNRFAYHEKPAFYVLKNELLRQFGRHDGYDLQVFYKYRHYWAQFYHYDMVWDYYQTTPPEIWLEKKAEDWNHSKDGEEWDYAEVIDAYRMSDQSGDHMLRCVSKHQHILERLAVRTEVGIRIYHRPVDEFHFIGYPTARHRDVLVKYSPRFAVYASTCKGKLGNVGDEKIPEGIDPKASLAWIENWCKDKDIFRGK